MKTPADIRIPTTLGFGLILLYLWPVITQPGSLALGASCGPAPELMWQMWSVGTAESTHLGFPGPPPSTLLDAPIMALVFVALKAILGNALVAWNTGIGLGFLVLLLGTLDLVHRLSPNSPMLARLTMVIAVVAAPGWSPVVGHLGMAAVPMMCVPLAISILDRWIQPHAGKGFGVLACVLTIVACSGHWTTTVFVLAILIPMAVIQCRNIEGRQAWLRALWVVSPGLLGGAILVGINAAPGNGINLSPESLGPEWIYQLEGALQLPATAVVALPGLGMLLLVLAGVAARPVRTVGWLLVGAWGILLAAGLGADGFEAFAPAHQLASRVPVLNHLGSWWGIAPLVSIPLGITAMYGVEALHKVRRERLAAAVLAVALIDQVLPTLTAPGAHAFRLNPSQGVQTALSNLPDGAVLQLPSAADGCTTHQLWQRSHGRAMSTPHRTGQDGGQQVSYMARLITRQMQTPGVQASAESPIDPATFICASGDIGTLQDLGFGAVVLDQTTGSPPVVANTLRLVLGEPIFEDERAAVWSLDGLQAADFTSPCPLPSRPG